MANMTYFGYLYEVPGGLISHPLDIQNPPVIPCEKLFPTPKSRTSGDVNGGSNTSSKGVTGCLRDL